MTLFQWLALVILAALVLWEMIGLFRHRTGWGVRLVRTVVWLVAAIAIAHPEDVQWLGSQLGIGRGADLVLYLAVLGFLGMTFAFYSRVRPAPATDHRVGAADGPARCAPRQCCFYWERCARIDALTL